MKAPNWRRVLQGAACWFAWCITPVAGADVVRLHVPFITDTPRQMAYFNELLTSAIRQAGHTPELVVTKAPQLRAKRMLASGQLSLLWMIETPERNNNHIPIEVAITGGLVGKRILLIKKGQQARFDGIRDLAGFRDLGLVAAMGRDWADAVVWAANGLAVREHSGAWSAIFRMLPKDRAYDYFPRGVNEVLAEAAQYPELSIERDLVFSYDQDFVFYLSKQGPNAGARYRAILTSALEQARESGLIQRLVDKYWGADLERLGLSRRINIPLAPVTGTAGPG